MRAQLAPRPTVLVSDDDRLLVSALERQARGRGLDVIRDGTSEVRTLARLQPSLILLDLNQEICGFELLAGLKAAPETAGIPVIVTSGDDDPSHRQRALELGAFQFVAKPFEGDFMDQVASLARMRCEQAAVLGEAGCPALHRGDADPEGSERSPRIPCVDPTA